jgi:hypothetical protein
MAALAEGPNLARSKNNDDGLVIFGLPGAPPGTLGLFVHSFEWDICSDNIHPVDQILMVGEVSDNDCGKAKYDRAAEPGELVIFAKHLNVFQRIYGLYY